MEININIHLEDYEHRDMPEGVDDPQDMLLTPRELGDAIAAFFKALDAKGQLMDPILTLPYINDDSEDIHRAICTSEHLPSRIIPFTELRGPGRGRPVRATLTGNT